MDYAPTYIRLNRQQVLEMLGRVRLSPDRFTAHRDRTFTAHYLRGRELMFLSDEFEGQLESADKRIAILKRPCAKIDRGRYITLHFAFAPFEVDAESAPPTRKPVSRKAGKAQTASLQVMV